jgi:hypothetical protein
MVKTPVAAVSELLITLEHARSRPGMYASTVRDTENLLRGIRIAINICLDDTDDFRIRGRLITESRWTWSSLPPWDEMRQAGLSEDQIIDEMYRIEILTWQRVLAKLQGGDTGG